MQVLRSSLQCKLPIEVVYSNEQEMSAQWRRKLEVRCPKAPTLCCKSYKLH